MTVPKSERETSTAQYLQSGLDLVTKVLSFTNRFPKRLANRLTNPICNHATEALCHVQIANRIYVTSDYEFRLRRGHLQEALGELDHVATLLTVCYELQVKDGSLKDPNDNVYGELIGLLDRERSLIGGVLRKDRESWGSRK